MEFKNLHTVYFLGIGGIGMSALALYFHELGITVGGYDKTPSRITAKLAEAGIKICFDEDVNHIPEGVDLVVFTPAVPKTHNQLVYFQKNKFNIKKRAEVLGLIAKDTFTIAVAGTHGKTTSSSIITHLLAEGQSGFMSFLGGIAKNYDTNYISAGDKNLVVAEADEYDRSFLNLFPDIAVITALDADHLDVYGSFENMVEAYLQFASQIKKEGVLITHIKCKKFLDNYDGKLLTYGICDNSDYSAENIRVVDGAYLFDIYENKILRIADVALNIGGRHNIENALAAFIVCSLKGLDVAVIKRAFSSYSGVYRRFDVRLKTDKIIYIDDYAHHPDELKAFISSVKEMFPNKSITGVFQPHLFSRTKDFAKEFAVALDALDDIMLLDIYPARELPIEGVSSDLILQSMKSPNIMVCSKSDVIEEVLKRKSSVILTIGAGDIDTIVEPLEKSLKNISSFY